MLRTVNSTYKKYETKIEQNTLQIKKEWNILVIMWVFFFGLLLKIKFKKIKYKINAE